MSSPSDWVARDLAHVWHPCTQMKDHETVPMIPLRSGSGVWLEDHTGKRYVDGISSWWVNLFGHANPRINAAIVEQLGRLEHAIFAGFTHEPAITLAEELVRLAPAGLNRCFFADNGSAAIEVAVKMSFHYWRNRGRPRKTRVITLSNSYHGETLGALAVGNVELYKSIYRPLLMDVITAPSPDAFGREAGVTEADHARHMFAHMEAALDGHRCVLARAARCEMPFELFEVNWLLGDVLHGSSWRSQRHRAGDRTGAAISARVPASSG
jgi:adenosylmethionine-8-amino-7-oxononanoate aminotransferase